MHDIHDVSIRESKLHDAGKNRLVLVHFPGIE